MTVIRPKELLDSDGERVTNPISRVSETTNRVLRRIAALPGKHRHFLCIPRTLSSSDMAVVPERVSSKEVACSCSLDDTCALLLASLMLSSLRFA